MITGGEEFFKDTNDDFSSGRRRSLRDFPTEKVTSIENIFLDVLGRKPSSREMAYYKYAAVDENEIRIKLLKSEEHKKILESASKLPGCEDQLRSLKVTERKLLQKVIDLEKEIGEDYILLEEKSSTISKLREEIRNPYNLPDQTKRYEEGFDVYTTPKRENIINTQRASVGEILRDIFNTLFK
jgi:hypothetical protein